MASVPWKRSLARACCGVAPFGRRWPSMGRFGAAPVASEPRVRERSMAAGWRPIWAPPARVSDLGGVLASGLLKISELTHCVCVCLRWV